MNWIRRVGLIADRVLMATVTACLGAVTVAVLVEVLMRHVLFMQFYGIEEIVQFLAAYLYFGSMVYVTVTKKHLSVGILTERVRDIRVTRLLGALVTLLCTIVAVAFTLYAARYMQFVIGQGQITPDLGYPRAVLVASLLLGFAAMTAVLIRDLVVELKQIPWHRERGAA